MKTFEAALFDMDGLLLDTERLCLITFKTALDEVNYPEMDQADAIFAQMVGLRARDSDAAFRAATAGRLDVAAFNRVWDQHLSDEMAKGVPVKFGALDLFARLSDQGTPIAVATSTPTDRAQHHLEEAGLLAFVHTVVGGDKVENGKPAPDIYLAAAQAIGPRADRCAAFEDSNVGIRAAVASGATAVQVPDILQPDASTKALGHVIANDLMSGARHIGLIT